MEEKEVTIEGKKKKIITKLPKEEIEDNTLESYLDDTINLEEVVKEITKENE